jgi:hypothetical protein
MTNFLFQLVKIEIEFPILSLETSEYDYELAKCVLSHQSCITLTVLLSTQD